MRIYKSVTQLIGNTPILEASNLQEKYKLDAKLFLKLEYFNPAGSVKDRVARAMIADAEKHGKLKKGGVIIEPTSGNTGIALAAIGTAKGYKVILTMPETMSSERIKLIKAYGAEVVLTEGVGGMRGAIEKANELAASTPGAVIAGQFTNFANPAAHRDTTGPEIWRDTDGKIDFFVAGVGTGGTVTGAGEFLKSKKPDIGIIAVEPSESPVISGGVAGAHGIQGIGAGFIPDVLNRQIIDEIIAVDDKHAFETANELAKTEGILAGISSGAALFAALILAKRAENSGKNIVVLLPDTGERYLSADLFP